MKHLLIIFTLLLTSVGWSKDVDFNDLVYRDGFWYEKFSNKPFNGKVIGRHQGKIKNGLNEGQHLVFFENGQLNQTQNWKDGKLDGEVLLYYENGKLKLKANYKNGNEEGEWLHYRSNGKLWRKYYYKDGKKDGKWTWYDKYGNFIRTELY